MEVSKEKRYTRLISLDGGRSIAETQTKQSGAESADRPGTTRVLHNGVMLRQMVELNIW